MVVGDLHVVGPSLGPREADAVLVVDANAVLTSPRSFEFLKPVSWRTQEILQLSGRLEIVELSLGDVPYRAWATVASGAAVDVVEHIFGPAVPES